MNLGASQNPFRKIWAITPIKLQPLLYYWTGKSLLSSSLSVYQSSGRKSIKSKRGSEITSESKLSNLIRCLRSVFVCPKQLVRERPLLKTRQSSVSINGEAQHKSSMADSQAHHRQFCDPISSDGCSACRRKTQIACLGQSKRRRPRLSEAQITQLTLTQWAR